MVFGPLDFVFGICLELFPATEFEQNKTKLTCFFSRFFNSVGSIIDRFLRVGCFRGGGNWGTLRIPREDWGTLRNLRED